MKIYENENGDLVIDGDNITTIKLPPDALDFHSWIKQRIKIPCEIKNMYFLNDNDSYDDLDPFTDK